MYNEIRSLGFLICCDHEVGQRSRAKKISYVDGQRLFLGIPKFSDQVTADPFLTRKFWNLKKKYFAKIFIDR